jgi:sec-independent protein translocase protein TatA
MGLSWWHILLVLLVFVLLFGTGKISGLMGDVAKGIKSFKQGMADDEDDEAPPAPKALEHKPAKPAARKKPVAKAKTSRSSKST